MTGDHYKTLGITPDATQEDVKKAFRRMTKEFHPDRNAARREWAHAHMKRVIEANRVLSNTSARELYDLRLGHRRGTVGASQRPTSRLRHRREGDSLLAQSERILHDLLEGRAAQAVENYERLAHNSHFDLGQHLDTRDWVDCVFLLGEQYAKRGRFDIALELYERLLNSDAATGRYSYFMQEVKDRIFQICAHDAASRARTPQETAQYYLRALALDLPRASQAFLHKKLAESYIAIEDEESARRHLAIAFQLKPDMKGAAKISRRLGITPRPAKEPRS